MIALEGEGRSQLWRSGPEATNCAFELPACLPASPTVHESLAIGMSTLSSGNKAYQIGQGRSRCQPCRIRAAKTCCVLPWTAGGVREASEWRASQQPQRSQAGWQWRQARKEDGAARYSRKEGRRKECFTRIFTLLVRLLDVKLHKKKKAASCPGCGTGT